MAGRPLEHRYGAPRPWRRRTGRVAVLLLGALAAGWLVWVIVANSRPEATSQLLAWEVAGPDRVDVRFEVDLRPGVQATCRLRALSRDRVPVGDAVVVVPADAGDAEGGEVATSIRTFAEATAVDLVGCTTPQQRRPQ
ncbi:DUF4307 domain-containing protein [Nocardioides zeae]